MTSAPTISTHPQGLMFTDIDLILCNTCGELHATMRHNKQRILSTDTTIRTVVFHVCFSCFIDHF